MKLHIITLGPPKLPYAKSGWHEYLHRLEHYHSVQVTHIPDKHNSTKSYVTAAGNSFKIALYIQGTEFSSPELARFLNQKAVESRELSFLIGGPDGLPEEVLAQADFSWSLGLLTFPHDLAMVMVVEALYRASTITASQPYHR